VEVAERYLEGEATDDELKEIDWDVEGAAFNIDYNCDRAAIEGWVEEGRAIPEAEHRAMLHPPGAAAEVDTRELLMRAAYFADFAVIYPHLEPKRGVPDSYVPFLSAALLRDLFGNPFRPVALAPAWVTLTVLSLARAAREERYLPGGELCAARLAVLADALEEAGCTEADLLRHLRGPGPHLRGCWALRALLGKE
jgi:hypothetical protein